MIPLTEGLPMSKLRSHPHVRAVAKFIRSNYGVTPTLSHRGKHPCLLVDYNDAKHPFRVSSSPSDKHALANAEREIRDRLGPPLKPIENAKRTMEQLMRPFKQPFNPPLTPQTADHIASALATTALTTADTPIPIPAAKAPVYVEAPAEAPVIAEAPVVAENAANARVAMYALYLALYIPTSLGEHLGGLGTGIDIRQIDTETWELRPNPQATRTLRPNRHGGYMRVGMGLHADTPHETFGSSPAEATKIDGAIVVVCSLATRVPVATQLPTQRRRWPTYKVQPVDEKPTPTNLESVGDGAVLAAQLAARNTLDAQSDQGFAVAPLRHHDVQKMREELAMIVARERTGWRLIRVEGQWRWRMADITLEDSGDR